MSRHRSCRGLTKAYDEDDMYDYYDDGNSDDDREVPSHGGARGSASCGAVAVDGGSDPGSASEVWYDTDGVAYTAAEFESEYGAQWQLHWTKAARADRRFINPHSSKSRFISPPLIRPYD